MISVCKKCLYHSEHPLSLVIDEDGICSGCKIHNEKNSIDWSARYQELTKLADEYKSKNKEYDCVVPVTGGNDSYFILDLVVNKLGLTPLIVTYNNYYNSESGIKNLANLRIRFDCDILIQNINPLSVKKITKVTLREFGSIYWHSIAGSTVFPVQVAVNYQIPLIIWGAHQGLEQVGMYSHLDNVEMTRRYRKEHDLMGYEADDLLSIFNTLEESDVWQYRYPDDGDLKRVGVRGIYLGNYIRWDPKTQHEAMISQYDYQTLKFDRTFDYYDYVHCNSYMGLHDILKLYKHGFSKVHDHATREIRHGRISRSTGEDLAYKYCLNTKIDSSRFCEWLGISQKSLPFILNQHRNKKFWEETRPGVWVYKNYLKKLSENVSGQHDDLKYLCNENINNLNKGKFITIGKGWP